MTRLRAVWKRSKRVVRTMLCLSISYTSDPPVKYESLSTSAVQASGDDVTVIQFVEKPSACEGSSYGDGNSVVPEGENTPGQEKTEENINDATPTGMHDSAVQGASSEPLTNHNQPGGTMYYDKEDLPSAHDADDQSVSGAMSPVDVEEEEELKKAIALSLSSPMNNDYEELGSDGDDVMELERAIALSMETPSALAGQIGSEEISTSLVQAQSNVINECGDMFDSFMVQLLQSGSGGLSLEQLAQICPNPHKATLFYEHILSTHMSVPIRLVQFLVKLARYWQSRSADSGEFVHMDKCLDFIAKATDVFSFGCEDTAIDDLISLWEIKGEVLRRRFEWLGDVKDIENSIEAYTCALDCIDNNEGSVRARVLGGLGITLVKRFERLGNLDNLDKSLLNFEQAVGLTSNGHPHKPSRLNNLGSSLFIRFERLGNLDDLDKSLFNFQQAVELTPNDHPDKPSWLNNLGSSLVTRFERLGNLDDLDKSLLDLQQAVDLTPNGHPDKPSWLNNLGSSLVTRFERLGNLDDLDKSLLNSQQAVELTPNGHPDKPSRLNNLGISLFRRFERLGNLDDLDKSLLNSQQAVELTPNGHPDKPSRLNNLGNSLFRRFERLGNLDDLDKSLHNLQQAVDLTPNGHPDKPSLLNNLGNSLFRRFERLGNLDDLDKSLHNSQQAVDLTPNGHHDKPSRLINLSSSLFSRFERLGNLDDIDKSLLNLQQAVDLTPNGHPDKPSLLNNLGSSLVRRFERLGNLDDLDKSLLNKQQAVELTPNGHPDKPSRLNNLSSSLFRRFERLGNLDDLNKSIINQQQVVNLTPHDHPIKAAMLVNLSTLLQKRYQRLSDSQDLTDLISSLRNAALSLSSNPSIRLDAARRCARLLYSDLETHRVIIALIPQAIWLGKSVEQRYSDLQTLGTAVLDAVSAACAAGAYDEALEWLEQGRAVIWGQILRLRSPVDDLEIAHPEYAEEVKRIAAALDTAGTNDPISSPLKSELYSEQAAQKHRQLAARWESLITTIRELPGFTDFLKPKSASSLKRASTNSTIVIVNVSGHRCDALILRSGSRTVEHLHLTSLSLEKLLHASKHLRKLLKDAQVRARDVDRGSKVNRTAVVPLPDILKMLWLDVAKPILDHIGYTPSPHTRDLPHITWCPTGPLACLPIHAAGLYEGPNGLDKIFNYVVSSYTPSLTALLEGIDKSPISTPSILAITQPNTPDLAALPGTLREVGQVEVDLKKRGMSMTRIDGEQATIQTVLEQMKNHNWVHLSCHGSQNYAEPTKSAFSLHDGKLELVEIMKKPLKQAELAYLSACQTATGDSTFPDESMHLAAGMFIAGYRSVVGTLWSIHDKDAPLVARVFYETLLDHPEGGVARALHEAVGKLRDTKGHTEWDLISWIPYIHIGH